MSISVRTDNLKGRMPLHRTDPRDCDHSLEAYIILDCKNERVSASSYSSVFDFDNGDGDVVFWKVDAGASAKDLKKLFASKEFLDLCEQIVEGFDMEWDGHQVRGSYVDEDVAHEAAEAIEDLIDKYVPV